MKAKLILLITLMVFAVIVNAQTAARDDFQLSLNPGSLTLSSGQTDSVSLSVLRSKSYKAGKAAFRLSSPSGNGIDAKIKQYPGQTDTCMLIVSVNDHAEPGVYNFIPSCTLNRKTKGVVLKITIQKSEEH